ncbi:hypothetical protein AWB81_03972 [Caballeronia arationis]|uniref:hypothetical protein n=1 Tax=Caballeronia arationis TaxID=1777142 RepID=UPI00074BACA5|nr:hypothetical protein [Caballeronia arationis]SAK80539.1 hypothetical protein AWB81_03972 [Caballeronia arationis]
MTYSPANILSACALAATMSICTPAGAAEVDFGLSALFGLQVTAGLDQQTLDVLRLLPQQLREQALLLIKQALPLIDESVNSYLDRVSSILDDTINHFQCAGVGVSESFWEGLPALLGYSPEPVTEAKKLSTKTRTHISLRSSPAQNSEDYGNLSYNLSKIACKSQISPATYIQVKLVQDDIFPRFVSWWRLKGKCADAATCLGYMSTRVHRDIDDADLRDIIEVGATERLHSIDPPGSGGKNSLNDVENSLEGLWFIEDSLRLARYRRWKLAKEAVAKADAILKEAKALYQNGRSNLSNTSASDDDAAAANAKAALAKCDQADEALGQGKAIWGIEQDPLFTTSIAELGKLRTDSASILSTAN